MTRALLFSLVLAAALHADTAVQTDWSGGPGVWGPVTAWGTSFYSASGVSWSGLVGSLVLADDLTEHFVEGDWNGIWMFSVALIDPGPSPDLVGCTKLNDEVAWWKNLDGTGESWERISIDTGTSGAYTVEASDIDGDGDLDVVSSWFWEDELVWYENDGTGSEWSGHLVYSTTDLDLRATVCGDLDADGDEDIAVGGFHDPFEVAWLENLDGSGLSWSKHTVCSGDALWPRYVCIEDVDGDSCPDLVGCVNYYEIVWWENDGSGGGWEEHLVYDHECNTLCAHCGDLDGDGDKDIVGAISHPNTPGPHFGEVVWCENLDSIGTHWQRHVIDPDLPGADCVHAADLDLDGDVDVIATAGEVWGG